MLTDTACWGQTRACTARPQLLHSDLRRRLLPRCLIRNEQCVPETLLCSILFHRQALPKKANSGINLPFKYTGHFVQNQWCDTDQDPDLASEECEPLASKKVDLHRGYHLCNLWSILFNNIFVFDFYWAYPQKWELELTFKTWSVGWLWNQTTKLPKIYMPLARQKFCFFNHKVVNREKYEAFFFFFFSSPIMHNSKNNQSLKQRGNLRPREWMWQHEAGAYISGCQHLRAVLLLRLSTNVRRKSILHLIKWPWAHTLWSRRDVHASLLFPLCGKRTPFLWVYCTANATQKSCSVHCIHFFDLHMFSKCKVKFTVLITVMCCTVL